VTADDLPTWQTNGIVYAVAEANGVVFAGGTFTTIRPPGAASGTQERAVSNFVALDAATGEPVEGCDLAFSVGSGTATVRAIAVSPDERTLYVGGTFGSVNGSGASSIAAFDLPSCTRRSFPVAADSMVRAIDATADRVYLGGDFGTLNGTARERFGAVTTAGAVVAGWVANADEAGKAIRVTPDGRHVLLGGDFFRVNGADPPRWPGWTPPPARTSAPTRWGSSRRTRRSRPSRWTGTASTPRTRATAAACSTAASRST
jgi:hypothetical protein